MSRDYRKRKKPTSARMSRIERAGARDETERRTTNILLVVIAIMIIFAGYFGGKEIIEVLSERYDRSEQTYDNYDDLKEILAATATSFGVNPDDIIWERSMEPYGEYSDMPPFEIRISSLYPKMLFHHELIENLVGSPYVISDCIETENTRSLDFTITAEGEPPFKFRLTSDSRVMPLTSYLTIIIGDIQSRYNEIRENMVKVDKVYGYILKPGVRGFTKTRELLSGAGYQILYDIPLQEDPFVRLMNAAASIVGLKRVRSFDQAMNVMIKLAGDFKYLYKEPSGNSIDSRMAESLGKAGFVIFSAGDSLAGEAGLFRKSGGRTVLGIPSYNNKQNDSLQPALMDYHRRILLSNGWGAIIVEAGTNTIDDLSIASRQLSRLNCRLAPISQLLMRIG
jgi:hypothetical protein